VQVSGAGGNESGRIMASQCATGKPPAPFSYCCPGADGCRAPTWREAEKSHRH
jgi:hypothetical protein